MIQDPQTVPVCLTIAGSDSGGGAGIQADLKAFFALGAFGTSAITCLTAQNPDEVAGILPATPEMVALQIRTVCRAFPVAAAKTGMLYAVEIVRAVAAAVREAALPVLVVDPVMVATSGAKLLRDDAVQALCRELFPLAAAVTPNLPEAEILAGKRIRGADDLKEAAALIEKRFGAPCVAKGGHLGSAGSPTAKAGPERAGQGIAVDVLCEKGEIREFRADMVEAARTHGTGCAFSAAITAFLARGETLADAVAKAKEFVTAALRHPYRAGRHTPLGIRQSTPDVPRGKSRPAVGR